ncbi:hypothetical protein STXM2123_1655 [Streptomyces sp. F-3]|nr:hypothetical protein STXM2123_1655 [Streptomyces sp. F-3]
MSDIRASAHHRPWGRVLDQWCRPVGGAWLRPIGLSRVRRRAREARYGTAICRDLSLPGRSGRTPSFPWTTGGRLPSAARPPPWTTGPAPEDGLDQQRSRRYTEKITERAGDHHAPSRATM